MKVKDLVKALLYLDNPELRVHSYDEVNKQFNYDAISDVTIHEVQDDFGNWIKIVVLK